MNNTLFGSKRLQFFSLFAAVLSVYLSTAVFSSKSVLADETCSQPTRPKMPDGSKASMEAMLAGQKAVKAFQASNMEYMQCLEREYSAAETTAKNSQDGTKKAEARAQYTKSINAYNAAVSAEEAVAGEFNVSLRAYKAANK
ncbi:hypothetical protein R0135_11615 [Congregibacter variabilis]|uniref:Uncharacterized protein n=1 Tax=Congregibacter variabilis TaxID=3081200 RepID=A0ABZ0I1M7_9GAMM|nr:hypothetical protein R0135_11615 [Congregibacter sp. IMCC43200]